MSDTLGIALTGLQNAALRTSNAASNIVNASSTTSNGQPYAGTDVISTASSAGGVSSEVVARPEGSTIDMASEIVQMKTAAVSYQANAKVVEIADRTHQRLVDALT